MDEKQLISTVNNLVDALSKKGIDYPQELKTEASKVGLEVEFRQDKNGTVRGWAVGPKGGPKLPGGAFGVTYRWPKLWQRLRKLPVVQHSPDAASLHEWAGQSSQQNFGISKRGHLNVELAIDQLIAASSGLSMKFLKYMLAWVMHTIKMELQIKSDAPALESPDLTGACQPVKIVPVNLPVDLRSKVAAVVSDAGLTNLDERQANRVSAQVGAAARAISARDPAALAEIDASAGAALSATLDLLLTARLRATQTAASNG